jgi:hypothetical protein
MYVLRGTAMLTSDGQTFPGLAGNPQLGNTGFDEIGAGTLLGIPWAIWMMIVLAVVIAYIARRLPFGRHVYAIGDNERAAELSGVKVKQVKVLVYTLSGLCAAIAGIVVSAQLLASHPANGTAFEMNAIAAVVLGGTSLAGGRGTVLGTLIGAFVIGFLADGLVMMGVSEFWQMVIKGIVIIVAVIIDQMQNRMQQKAAVVAQKAVMEGNSDSICRPGKAQPPQTARCRPHTRQNLHFCFQQAPCRRVIGDQHIDIVPFQRPANGVALLRPPPGQSPADRRGSGKAPCQSPDLLRGSAPVCPAHRSNAGRYPLPHRAQTAT